MIKNYSDEARSLLTHRLTSDFVIVGGGLAGVCSAITAARLGVSVILVQDRPVLGGNSSSEVRLWVLGATSHMGNNNRWAREGGVIDEIMLENGYRNPEGNPLIFDTILLEKVVSEPNITLLLNTAVYELKKSDADTISTVIGFCSQNSTRYELTAPLFCDASGDGILGFLAGAAFRMGAESREEFGEKFAPTQAYGELLGHSIYFYSKDTGRPVRFVPPGYALTDITKIPRYKNFKASEFGCRLWWIEYGGRLDTVHETETIKWELWRVVYGVWNHIKNSGQFPEAENLTLEWVGTIPGKRESRRFEGDYMLKQQDIVEQQVFNDAVAFGGWSIDLHPADGIFSEKPGCNQWHSKGIYGIPYRCYYSRNISNLFLAGRIISASHVAFGSTRVMATSAHGGQAVGVAAMLGKKHGLLPRQIGQQRLVDLQLELLRAGQHLPHHRLHDPLDLVRQAHRITATSSLLFTGFQPDGHWRALACSMAQMLPVDTEPLPTITLDVRASQPTILYVALRRSHKPENHTPELTLEQFEIALHEGLQTVTITFTQALPEAGYAFVVFLKNEYVELPLSNGRITGLLSVFNQINPAVSNYGRQQPAEDIGVDTFEFWCPERRPNGQNLAFRLSQPLACFRPENLRNGLQRPVGQPNAWVADWHDQEPMITISWAAPMLLNRIELAFDSDYDNPLENVLIHHPETTSPFCADKVEVLNGNNQVVAIVTNNHLSRRTIRFNAPITTQHLKLKVSNLSPDVAISLFEVRCYLD